MEAKDRHYETCFRFGRLTSMIVLSLLVNPVLAGDDHVRHGHHRNSRHTSNHRNFGHHSHSHYGHNHHSSHHIIIHVPRYYLPSYYGLPSYFSRYRFSRYPINGFGNSSWPAYELSGDGGKIGPLNTELPIGKIVSTPKKNGWTLLADGQASIALDVFAQQAQRNSNYSGPKIGYALSVAVAGDLYFGVWEMRRASRINSASMRAFKLPEQLRPTVEELIKTFKAEQLKNTRKADVSFMLASLHYLMQNSESAKREIDLAIREGDRSQSALNLNQIIDQQATKAQADHDVAQKNAGGDVPVPLFAPPIPGQTE
jgi:hypothetical protein